MANYRSIHVRMWSDPAVETLSPMAKLLFIYLLTNPHRNESCLYQLSTKKMADETGMKLPEIEKMLQELSQAGRVFYDTETFTVWVVNAVKHQSMNANCVKSIHTDLERCSSKVLATAFCRHYNGFGDLTTVCNGFLNLWETLWNGLPNPPIGYRVQGTGLGGSAEGGAGRALTKREEFDADIARLVIPDRLNTPAFAEWWGKWVENRYGHKKPKSGWFSLFGDQLKLLAEYSLEDAIHVVKKSTTNGYQGLVDPPKDGKNSSPPTKNSVSNGIRGDVFNVTT